mmetsp:Transcript_48722/g.143790  ORF Transcript_48722/g.143790 Transcript_48722/m.143790 type:complete len:295 (-) Transcript_48722:304-1188(-)
MGSAPPPARGIPPPLGETGYDQPGYDQPQGVGMADTDEIAARAEALLAERGEERRPERPRTAGRRPPKVVARAKESSEEPVEAPPAPIIFGDGGGKDDDEDLYEEQQENNFSRANVPEAQDDGQHGKLVANLLAEKKKEEEQQRLKQEEEATREEFDDQQGKGIRMGKLKRKKDGVSASAMAEVDVPKLGAAIQQLCQAANPLGKSIDLVHQDIANMGKELDKWKQEYREASEMLYEQARKTQEILQPMAQKVAELDDKILEQKAKISNSRLRISQNDAKIQVLLQSVVSGSRG